MWLKSTFHKKFKISVCNIQIKTKCSIKCKEVYRVEDITYAVAKRRPENLGLPAVRIIQTLTGSATLVQCSN